MQYNLCFFLFLLSTYVCYMSKNMLQQSLRKMRHQKLAIYQLCQSMPRTGQGEAGTKQGQAGTRQGQTGASRDKAGTNRGKQGQSLSVPACPYLSLSVPVCPCLSLLVLVCPCISLSALVCPCLSLYISTFAIPACLPLQMNITVFINMNIGLLTFLARATVPMHANLVFNLFFFFYSSDAYHKGLHLVSLKLFSSSV